MVASSVCVRTDYNYRCVRIAAQRIQKKHEKNENNNTSSAAVLVAHSYKNYTLEIISARFSRMFPRGITPLARWEMKHFLYILCICREREKLKRVIESNGHCNWTIFHGPDFFFMKWPFVDEHWAWACFRAWSSQFFETACNFLFLNAIHPHLPHKSTRWCICIDGRRRDNSLVRAWTA